MITNKSLSARVKRRNLYGFKGTGNYNYEKKNDYGDYKNPAYNHKSHDLEIINLVNRARKIGYRHPGSMNYKRLKAAVK